MLRLRTTIHRTTEAPGEQQLFSFGPADQPAKNSRIKIFESNLIPKQNK
jgi:hypothetical protein